MENLFSFLTQYWKVLLILGIAVAFISFATQPAKKEKTVHKAQKYGTIDRSGLVHVGGKTLTPAEAERKDIHITGYHKEAPKKKKWRLLS